MKFKYGTRRKAIEYEKDIAQWWKENKIFEKSVEQRSKDNAYVFYDGPPFITGNPHHGTLLSSVVKDAVGRYWTMKGKRVERVWGWDCHGLPAENFVEKQLGITDRREIGTKISLEDYVKKARESMVANSETWEQVIDRIGRWVDFKGAYKTMDKDFMESVWWAFKTLYDKGLIYEGKKVLMYDTKFATPVSKAEVTMDNDAYQTVTDPSVFVKFRVKDQIKSDKIIKIVKSLGFSLDEVLVVTTGILDVLGLCESDDIDIVVSDNVIQQIKDSGEWKSEYKEFPGKIMYKKIIDGIEVETSEGYDWVVGYDKEVGFGSLIKRAENLDGVYFNNLKDLLTLKKLMNREKDQEHIKLLEKYTNSERFLLAWTTTPWTLPANMALAVNPKLKYVEVAVGGENLILAKDLVEKVLADEKHQPLDYEIVREMSGKDLVGLQYEPIFQNDVGENAHKIYVADFVENEGGTGIVHIAPAYGEDDFALAEKHDIPVVDVLDDEGFYLPEMAEQLHKIGVKDTGEQGIECWEGNKFIAKCLAEQKIVWKIDYIRHEYPFNPRSKQRIMYRAFPSWFFDVAGQKPLMLAQNQNINWFPGYIKNGRFAKNIEAAPDWNLSRDRFWATAMPVWKGDKGSVKVVGSYDELEKLSGVKLDDYHRPWVDEVEFDIAGEHFSRIDKVLDCWFESGSMPFAQMHYPFENKEKFEVNYPADFITEYIPQVRAWFYYVHVVNTALFGEYAYKNVIVTGTIAGSDGRKMSKSLGNYTDPNELMDKFSADSLRFLLLSSPLLNGEDFSLQDKDVGDVARKLAMVWNMYDFFTMYAEVDGWQFGGELTEPQHLTNPLDKWIVSRLHQTAQHVEKHLDDYNTPEATSEILPFLDDASNWYVRRSRRRFWKGEDDGDKGDAYRTLHYVLAYFAQVIAPFCPFMAEELWQKMVGGESVHLLDWPKIGEIDKKVLADMARTREIIERGLALRMNRDDEHGQIKVRQPLARLAYPGEKLDDFYEGIIADEVNVKAVGRGEELTLDKEITPELKREGQAREVIRVIQNARKNAGLNVDDRIKLSLGTKLDKRWQELVAAETLATEVTQGSSFAYEETAKVDGENITVSLEKA
ncbi:MAG: class I tRNA ligase family protein [Candidatus Nomurabacteria bacterium]|jgi:isoleucyl-tRNA synthetase|nr:class I tRNA ligase family protein [Candidatus Nomurabacteria bacterium]